MLGMSACLELNPEYVDRSATEGASDDAADESASNGEDESSGGEACVPDDLEPNDDYGDASDTVELGNNLSGTIDSDADVDWFKGPADTGDGGELLVRTSGPTLRACIYIACNETEEPATIEKCTGVLDTDDFGNPGCCGPRLASIEYTCAVGTLVIYHARVDNPAASECTPYDVELGVL